MKKFYDVSFDTYRKGSWGLGISGYRDTNFQVVGVTDEEGNFSEVNEPFIESEWRFSIDLFKWVLSLTMTKERK